MYKKNRNVDVVFCIDETIEGLSNKEINNLIQPFVKKLKEEILFKGDEIEQLRVKIITFSDYLTANKDNLAIKESIFFEIPMDTYNYKDYLDEIKLNKQPSDKTNGLEALYLAMQSDFVATKRCDRQIIVLITGKDALPFQERANCPGYPTDMPKDIEELSAWWMYDQRKSFGLGQKQKRLVIFAPKGTIYDSYVSNHFDQAVFLEFNCDNGWEESRLDNIMRLLF